MVPAAEASSGVGVAVFGVSVAGAESAAGEAPVSWQTAVTLPTVRSRNARALTAHRVAKRVLRALDVAFTRCRHKTRRTQLHLDA